LKSLKKWYNEKKRKYSDKYYPSLEWFNFSENPISENLTPIETTIQKFQHFFRINHEENLFKEKDNIFPDVCFNLITIDKKFLPILNHPFMIRLGELKQLSFTYKIFSSANHSRFSHSIGTFKRISDFIKVLIGYGNEEVSNYIRDKVDILKVYALIHDIGHHPFSHSLEHLFKSEDKDMLPILLKESRGLRNIIKNIIGNDGLILLTKLVISRGSSEKDLLPLELLLKKCIDSPLDADRMDYLPRDQLLCGKDQSKAKVESIIANMIPYKREDGKWLIAYSSECVSDIVEFLHARWDMYNTVYELDKKVILEELIARITFQICSENKVDLNNLEFFTEDFILSFLIEYADTNQRKLLNMAIFGNNYKNIKTITVGEFQKKRHLLPKLEPMKDDIALRFYYEKNICEKVKTINQNSTINPNKNYIIFHYPREYIKEVDRIILIDKDNKPKKLEDDDYYKNQREINLLKAPYLQIFLLDIQDGNFETNKRDVIQTFKIHFTSKENNTK